MRPGVFVHRTRALGLAAAMCAVLALAGLGAAGASSGQRPTVTAVVGPFTGVGEGLIDRFRHLDNQQSGDDRFFSDSKDVYRVRFTYSFRIENNGSVTGRGDGTYLSATWRLDGKNGKNGNFGCDVPITTRPFTVDVSGRATASSIELRFELVGARETNSDYDCGAGYTGFSTDSTYAAESLELVQESTAIRVNRASPSIPPLRRLVETGDERDRRVNLHEWTITIKAPAGSGSDSGGGGGGGGSGGFGSGKSGPCTITGTPGNDVLNGTAGSDVICGRGGNDVIRGLGGNDTIRGEAGNDSVAGGAGHDTLDGGPGRDQLSGNAGRDLLLARDRAADFLVGGPGRDSGRIDRGRDRTVGVEVLS